MANPFLTKPLEERIMNLHEHKFLANLNKDIASKVNDYLENLKMQINNFKFIQDREKTMYIQYCWRGTRIVEKSDIKVKLIDMGYGCVDEWIKDSNCITGHTATPIRIKRNNNMTLLKFVNVSFFQWFFVRLTRCENKIIKSCDPTSFNILPGNKIGMQANNVLYDTIYLYSIQYFILPCTGWWNKFIYLNGKPKFIKISKTKFK